MPSRTMNMQHAYILAALVMMLTSVTPSAASAQASSGWTEKQVAQRAERYAALTPASVEKVVDVIDDDLEPTATLTTERAFTFKGSFTDRVRADSFFRAVVGKKTGATVYQIYTRLRYSGELRRFNFAHYDDQGEPISVPLTVADRRIECPYGVCGGIEDLAFEVPENTMRALATQANDRPVRAWRFRLKADNAQDWTDDIAPAEAAGLLLAVVHYRREHKLP